MARTKAAARKGPSGKAYRERNSGAKALRGPQIIETEVKRIDKKRQREGTTAQREQENTINDSSLPLAKKAKLNATSNDASLSIASLTNTADKGAPPALPSTIHTDFVEDSALLPELSSSYNSHPMNIISSSQIQNKVTRILETLAEFSFVNPPSKPNIVVLRAKASAASKMISVIEIVKREIAGSGGKWYQYSRLEGSMITKEIEHAKLAHQNGRVLGRSNELDSMDIGDTNEDDEAAAFTNAFETMKTPFERAIEGNAKVQLVPLMTIYLSRVSVEKLKNTYGEQTNVTRGRAV